MKTVVYFIITLLISAGFLLGALNTHNPYPLFVVAFGIWVLFFWGWRRRLKKQAERRSQEQVFAEYMRSKISNDRRQV
jgi:hypothetical protein